MNPGSNEARVTKHVSALMMIKKIEKDRREKKSQ